MNLGENTAVSGATGFELSVLTANDLIYGFLAFLFSVLLTFALTPVVRALAYRIGAVDYPKDARRMHKDPTPLIGGLGIFVSFTASALLFLPRVSRSIAGMLIGMLLMVLLGVADDVWDLNPFAKLFGQLIAAAVPVFFGQIRIESIILGDNTVLFPEWLSVAITVFWIVCITNSVNLIDGLDGLACGISVIASFCLLLSAIISSAETTIAVLALLLAGACLGFLPYNLHPAKIFMGDTGSLMLGYALATLSVIGVFKFNAIVSFLVPFLILGIPFGDTLLAIVRRISHHQSPFKADRGHLHHKLVDMGFSQKSAVLILYAISALLGICAVMFTGNYVRVAIYVFLIGIAVVVLDFVTLSGKNEQARIHSGVMEHPETPEPPPPAEESAPEEEREPELYEEDAAPLPTVTVEGKTEPSDKEN